MHRHVVVANSFAEFIWRWWTDIDIFYRAVVGNPLTPDEQSYAAQYGSPTSL